MSFAWPALLFLLSIPAAVLAWDLTRRRRTATAPRPKILRAEAGANSLKLSDFSSPSLSVAAKPRFWLCAGIALAVVALARPQWGRIEEPVFDQSREILLAIDLSRSMLTPDIKPSRLDRAKLLIQSLLEKLEGERVGLLVFAGTAFLQSPLSADYEILREFLPALGPEFLPEGGSNYGALLTSGIQAFSATNAADRFLVILSDGEATDDNWRAQLTELKNKNIRVIGLGVGTTAGAFIPDGAGGLVKDERGAVVLSKLESATLQELAQATGGIYRDAGTWVDLAALVNETVDRGRKGEFVEKNTIRLVERFQWPLALGLWCLLVSFCYEFPVRPRPRDVQLAPGTPGTPPRLNPTGPGAGTAALLLFALLGIALYPKVGFSAVVSGINAPNAAPAAGNPAEPSPLTKIVGRIATVAQPSGRDWADLGRETVNWGERLKSAQQTVPEGPIRDALAAVELGVKAEPKATDWTKLREELEALLKKPDDQEKEQDQQQPQDQKQDQQNKDQQKQDQDQQKSDQQKQDQSGDPQDQKNSDQKQEPEQKEQNSPEQPKPQGESAFGDMNQKQEPPPPPPEESTQKVGGAPERKEEQKEADPALALPLQKLDQLRNQDSPAQLFQLMEGDKKSSKKTGKDW